MKVYAKDQNGTAQHLDVASLIITFSNGETIEITDESPNRPANIAEGVTVWGGRMPEEGASLDKLKNTTRGLGIYPMAANTIHIFPYPFSK
ncbi:hypothetical protein Q9R34_20575 [Enterobacter sp. BRE11]|nr:hypothetical protein [Enterobacter sp. BRE11]